MLGLRHLNWSGVLICTALGSSSAACAAVSDPSTAASATSAARWSKRTSISFPPRGSIAGSASALLRLKYITFEPSNHTVHDLLVVLLQHHRMTVAVDARFRQH